MNKFDELYNNLHNTDAEITRIRKKIWFFEWFLLFLTVYMCFIAYNLYTLNWDVIEATHTATANTQFIFP